jgi:hypothetical protein
MDSEVINTQLVLVSARKSRGADYWDKDDYGCAAPHPCDLNRMLNQVHQYKSKHAYPDRSDTGP